MEFYIYAVRDRLIDYFMTPFCAPSDKHVLASLANVINNTEATDAIAQAPHHFEIWKLGTVHEDGHIEPQQGLITDCASLVRPGIRTREERGAQPDTQPAPGSQGAPGSRGSNGGATNGPPQNQARPAPGQAQEARPRPGRVPGDA